jgi:hypothetical protein
VLTRAVEENVGSIVIVEWCPWGTPLDAARVEGELLGVADGIGPRYASGDLLIIRTADDALSAVYASWIVRIGTASRIIAGPTTDEPLW